MLHEEEAVGGARRRTWLGTHCSNDCRNRHRIVVARRSVADEAVRKRHQRGQRKLASEHGSAIADFALVSGLVMLVVLGIVQLTLTLHVRATLIDCAGEGARYGAVMGRSVSDATSRAADLAGQSLAPSFGQDVSAQVVRRGDRDVVEVTIRAPIPLIGLVGPRVMTLQGHAVVEGQQ